MYSDKPSWSITVLPKGMSTAYRASSMSCSRRGVPHALRVAIQATATVSIVGIDLETDPVRARWVKTLARPGDNVTGFFLDMPERSEKLVQFLIETIPRLQRLAIMWDAELASSRLRTVERAAPSLKIKTQSLPFRRTEEFRGAFEMAQRAQVQARERVEAERFP